MGFYERQFGEQIKKRENEPAKEKKAHPVWSNWFRLFITNFKLILFFVPALIFFYLYLMVGGMLFWLGAVLCLPLAGPACAAAYNDGYEIARGECFKKGFFSCYAANFRQGLATMAIVSVAVGQMSLCMSYISSGEAQVPAVVIVCLILEAYLIVSFAVMAFSQIALVDLPLTKIWKNSLLMIFLCGWKGFKVTVVWLIFIVALYCWIEYTFLLLLFLIPAMLVAWSACNLWPKCQELLIHEEMKADNESSGDGQR